MDINSNKYIHLSLNKLAGEEYLDEDPYVINPSYGIHRLRMPHE